MVLFPNIKINIGLNIVAKRNDGYHAIESIFYPVGLCDILEVVEARKTAIHVSGIQVLGDVHDNLCVKAYEMLKRDHRLPPVNIYLHKIIPTGAGLGGGSADGAFMIRLLNEQFALKLSAEQMNAYAAQLGSDCPFFISNKPSHITGRGEVYKNIDLDLSGYCLLIVHPGIHVNTKDAFTGVKPREPEQILLNDIKTLTPEKWEGRIKNQFEETVFIKYPEIKKVKEQVYKMGALYASMSGSGSAVYGLFKNEIKIPVSFKKYFVWKARL